MATSNENGDKLCQVDDQSLEKQPQVELPSVVQVNNQEQPPPKVQPATQKSPHGRCGYDCEFVQPPPEAFQTDCSVCLQVLCEPHLISCCGHNFCRTCITRIKVDSKGCPLCNSTGFSLMHNKGLERSLKGFKVQCTHAKSGCEWVDELGLLDHHLNVDPSSDKQLEGCNYVEVQCSHGCGGYFQRRLLANHQGEECPKRPYSCNYCRDYASTFEELANNHWPECKCYPLSCPNHCTPYAIERQNLEHHVSKDCPLTVVKCDFQYAGCEVQLPRKDMPAHLRDNFTHMSQLAILNQKLTDKLLRKDEEIDILGLQLKAMTATLSKKDEEMKVLFESSEQQIQTLKDQLADIKSETASKADITALSGALSQEISSCKENLARDMTKVWERQTIALQHVNTHLVVPIDITMPDFDKQKTAGGGWYSNPFYTHPGGYKMCLKVDTKGTLLSVYAILMRGEFDDYLKWPLVCDIHIQLLNQKEDREHYERILAFGDKKDEDALRVTKGKKAKGGWGAVLLSHPELQSSRGRYLKDNTICFKVTEIQLKE